MARTTFNSKINFKIKNTRQIRITFEVRIPR